MLSAIRVRPSVVKAKPQHEDKLEAVVSAGTKPLQGLCQQKSNLRPAQEHFVRLLTISSICFLFGGCDFGTGKPDTTEICLLHQFPACCEKVGSTSGLPVLSHLFVELRLHAVTRPALTNRAAVVACAAHLEHCAYIIETRVFPRTGSHLMQTVVVPSRICFLPCTIYQVYDCCRRARGQSKPTATHSD